MKFITVTELKQHASQIVTEIKSTKERVIITKYGKPVISMNPITDKAFNLKEEEEKNG